MSEKRLTQMLLKISALIPKCTSDRYNIVYMDFHYRMTIFNLTFLAKEQVLISNNPNVEGGICAKWFQVRKLLLNLS